MTRQLAVVLLLVAGVAHLDAMQPPDADPSWTDSLARAASEQKPIVVFSHYPLCPDGSTCRAFIDLAGHPANQRRLREVIFTTRLLEDGDPDSSVSVHTPDGTRLIRWMGIPDAVKFAKILEGVEDATPHIAAAYRAKLGGMGSEERQETVLAMLALGYELRARPLVAEMLASPSAEDRQLGAIWLEQLDALRQKRLPDEALLGGFAVDGATPRVRYESWMALGDVRLASGRLSDAATAYDAAADSAGDDGGRRRMALDAKLRAEQLAAPVKGLGSPGSIVTGRRTVWPRAIPEHVAAVEYRLDGERVALSKKAPFAVAIDFGRLPSRHELSLAALDVRGEPLHASRVVVNDRVDQFSVEIVEPSSSTLSGEVDVLVAVKAPRGLRVESAFIEWNGAVVARSSVPPFRASVSVAPEEQGILRAVARLEDGSELEDVQLVNSGPMALDSDVHLVEIPVYADEGQTLTRESVTVKEDGAMRPVDRVVSAADTPLLVALVIDASWSMTGNMLDVQEAAIRFVERNLSADDRVMVVGFDTRVRILWPTNDRALVERAILSVQARGQTSLNDALLSALLQLQAPGRRRALVAFSDGLDNASTFTSGEVTEVARRSGVPIYVLSLRPEPPSGVPGLAKRSAHWVFAARTELMRVAQATGGKAYDLRSLDAMQSIWDEIGDDLRRQSLVVYRPAPAAKEWRALELFASKKRLRAPSGIAIAANKTSAAK